MPERVWKEFEQNPLTHSAAHYIMAIRDLLAEHGYARVTDVARRLGITRGSCSLSLKLLKKRGLVLEDANKFLLLSPEAERLAVLVGTNDDLLKTLFTDLLGVSPEQATVDACKMEHLLGSETTLRLAVLVKFIKSGHPAAEAFLKALAEVSATCVQDPSQCPICTDSCQIAATRTAIG